MPRFRRPRIFGRRSAITRLRSLKSRRLRRLRRSRVRRRRIKRFSPGSAKSNQTYFLGFQHPKFVIQNGTQDLPVTLANGPNVATHPKDFQLPWAHSYPCTSASYNLTVNPVLTGWPRTGLPMPQEAPYGIMYPLRFSIMPGVTSITTDMEFYQFMRIKKITYEYRRSTPGGTMMSVIQPYIINCTRSKSPDPIYSLEAFRSLPHFKRFLRPGKSVRISFRPTVRAPAHLLTNVETIQAYLPSTNQLYPNQGLVQEMALPGRPRRMPWISLSVFWRLLNTFLPAASPPLDPDQNFKFWASQHQPWAMANMSMSGPFVVLQGMCATTEDAMGVVKYPGQMDVYDNNGAIMDGTDVQCRIIVTYQYRGKLRKQFETQGAWYTCWPGGLPVQGRMYDEKYRFANWSGLTGTSPAPVVDFTNLNNGYWQQVPTTVPANPEDAYPGVNGNLGTMADFLAAAYVSTDVGDVIQPYYQSN